MASYSAGEATVSIIPDLSGFQDRLRAELNSVTVEHTVTVRPDLADFSARLQAALAAAGAGAGRQGGSAGSNYGDEFSRVVKTRIEAALRSLPEVQIGVATTEAEQKLRDLHTRLETLRDQKIGIDIDAKDALAEVEKIRLELDELSKKSPDIQVRVDAGRALAELKAVQEEVNRLDGKRAEVKVDTGSAAAGLSSLVVAAASIGPALIPIGAAAIAGLGGIATLAVAGGAALGVLYLGLSGVIGAVGDQAAAQKSAAADAKASAKAQEAAAAQVANAQSSLSNAIRSADNSAITSAQSVKDARTSLANALTAAGDASVKSAQAVSNAEDGLASAIRAADNAAISSAQAVASARTGLADAQRSASASVANALSGQETAQRALTQAEQSAQLAEDALTAARKTAQQQIQDLTNSVADGALAQRQANLSVETSKINLDKVLANPASSVLQREQAQLTYDQAVQQVTDIGVRQQRLQEKKAAADQAGVEGSATVVAAQRGVSTAVQGVSNAQDAVGKAAAAVAEAQRAGAEAVGKAQQALANSERAQSQQAIASQDAIGKAQQAVASAQQAQAQQVIISQQSIAKAQESVDKAQRAQAQQAEASAAAVDSAQRALVTAQDAARDAATKTSAAADKAKASLDALTPAGQEFVTFIVSTLNPVLSRLKDTAQAGLLPGLEDGIKGLLPVMPLVDTVVGQLARTMGDLFREAGQALNSPFYRQFISYIGDEGSRTIKTFGEIIGNLVTGFAGLLQAFAPLSDGIGNGLLILSGKFADFGRNTGGSSGFQSFLKYVQDVSPLVVKTFEDLGRTLGNLIEALAPYGVVVLTAIDGTSRLVNALGPNGLVLALAGAATGFAVFKVATGGFTLNPILLAVAGLTAAFAKLYADKGPDGGDSEFKKFIDDRTQAFGKDLPTVIDLTKQGFHDLGSLLSGSFLEGSDRASFGVTKLKDSTKNAGDASSGWAGEQKKLQDAQGKLTDATGKLNDEIQKSISKFTILRTGTLDAMTASDTLAASYDALSKSTAENGVTLDGNTEKGRANRKAVNDVAQALNDKATADFKTKSTTDGLSAATDQATTTVEENRKKLIDNLIQTGYSRQAAEDYTAKLLLTPAEIRTQVNTPGLIDAHTNVDALQQKVDGLKDKNITVSVTGKFDPQLGGIQDAIGNIHVPGGGVLLKALGGAISGPGGPRGDKIPALLSDNEHVVPSDEVDMLGGQQAMYKLRQVIRAGELPGFAYGGAVNNGGLNRDPRLNVGGVDRTVTVQGVSNFDNFNTGLEVGLESFAQAVGAVVNNAYTQAQQAPSSGGGAPGGNYTGPIPGGDAVGRWRGLVDSTLGELGLNVGLDDKVLRQIATESGGDPNATQGDIGDVNNASGDLARGLMQVIGTTFRAYAGPYASLGQYDPHASIYAGLNYARATYGPDLSFLGQGHGYDTGGVLPPGYSSIYNGTGQNEVVLNPQQVEWVHKGMAEGGGGPQIVQHIYPQANQSEAQIAADLERRLLFVMR